MSPRKTKKERKKESVEGCDQSLTVQDKESLSIVWWGLGLISSSRALIVRHQCLAFHSSLLCVQSVQASVTAVYLSTQPASVFFTGSP